MYSQAEAQKVATKLLTNEARGLSLQRYGVSHGKTPTQALATILSIPILSSDPYNHKAVQVSPFLQLPEFHCAKTPAILDMLELELLVSEESQHSI